MCQTTKCGGNWSQSATQFRELLVRCRAAIDDQRDGKTIADQTIDLIWEPLR